MLYPLARSVLFRLDPEVAHELTLSNLDVAAGCGLTRVIAGRVSDLPVQVMGLTFRNPVGLAAGMDKNAAHIDALGTFGFGHIEAGTVSPRPQPGNPKPRLFRLVPAQGLPQHDPVRHGRGGARAIPRSLRGHPRPVGREPSVCC